MKHKFGLSVLLIVFASTSVWAQFWTGWDERQRQSVGEAYWLAGTQYKAIGKTDKGNEYMAVARRIYPPLDPSRISDQSLPSAAELLSQGKAAPIGPETDTLPTGAVSSFFLRFAGALASRDADGAAGFLDGSVYLSKLPREVTREEARAALEDFFTSAPAERATPSSLYDIDSIVVARPSGATPAAWGETCTLSVTARADYSQSVSFWDMEQRFYLHRASGAWSIFAFGDSPPPRDWVPREAAAASAAPPAAEPEVDQAREISGVFHGFMAALLGKDADTAVQGVSENVRFLRVRQTITREELRTSLLGYYENPGFKEATPEDALDLDSVFVEAADSPVDGVSGPVYVLNVKARQDLTSSLPIWSTYQTYYFAKDGSDWKIFAILI